LVPRLCRPPGIWTVRHGGERRALRALPGLRCETRAGQRIFGGVLWNGKKFPGLKPQFLCTLIRRVETRRFYRRPALQDLMRWVAGPEVFTTDRAIDHRLRLGRPLRDRFPFAAERAPMHVLVLRGVLRLRAGIGRAPLEGLRGGTSLRMTASSYRGGSARWGKDGRFALSRVSDARSGPASVSSGPAQCRRLDGLSRWRL
jgi:hypothetical protein